MLCCNICIFLFYFLLFNFVLNEHYIQSRDFFFSFCLYQNLFRFLCDFLMLKLLKFFEINDCRCNCNVYNNDVVEFDIVLILRSRKFLINDIFFVLSFLSKRWRIENFVDVLSKYDFNLIIFIRNIFFFRLSIDFEIFRCRCCCFSFSFSRFCLFFYFFNYLYKLIWFQ